MSKLTKKHEENMPQTEKMTEKTKFRCRHCNKKYEDWTGCYECPCKNKTKWAFHGRRPRARIEKSWRTFIGVDKRTNLTETERHKKAIQSSKSSSQKPQEAL